jgi:hypothetical protein
LQEYYFIEKVLRFKFGHDVFQLFCHLRLIVFGSVPVGFFVPALSMLPELL